MYHNTARRPTRRCRLHEPDRPLLARSTPNNVGTLKKLNLVSFVLLCYSTSTPANREEARMDEGRNLLLGYTLGDTDAEGWSWL